MASQLYVILSRVKKLHNITFVGPSFGESPPETYVWPQDLEHLKCISFEILVNLDNNFWFKIKLQSFVNVNETSNY